MAIIKNTNANAENRLPIYTGYIDETTHIHIIDGNSEMGKGIYHYSTLAGNSALIKKDGTVITDIEGTCGHHCENCEDICYAKNYCKRNYRRVVPAYIDNTLLLRGDRNKFFRELEDFFNYNIVGCFRPHVSGEFIDYDHFERMCKFIAQHKETQFYCYTEAEEYVNKAEDKGIIPDNFIVWISCCDKLRESNPRNHRLVYLDNGKNPNPAFKGMFHCPKNTPEGKKSGITCSMCKTCPYGKAGGKGKEIRELAIWMH